MPESCPIAPSIADVYRQLGALAAETEHRREGQDEIKAALEDIKRRVHQIANSMTPLLSDVEKHGARISKLEGQQDDRDKADARQAGVRKGVGIGLAIGGGSIGAGLIKFFEWFVGGPGQ